MLKDLTTALFETYFCDNFPIHFVTKTAVLYQFYEREKYYKKLFNEASILTKCWYPNGLLYSMQPVQVAINLNITIYKFHQSQLNSELPGQTTINATMVGGEIYWVNILTNTGSVKN